MDCGPSFLAKLKRGDDVGAGRGADKEAELAVQSSGHCEGVGAGHLALLVDRRIAQELGKKAVGDALDVVAAGALAGKKGGLGWLHGHDARLRVAGLDRLADAGKGSAGAEARDKGVNRDADLLDDFGAGLMLVIQDIERVLELRGRK